jgi:hypothetical protein
LIAVLGTVGFSYGISGTGGAIAGGIAAAIGGLAIAILAPWSWRKANLDWLYETPRRDEDSSRR